ncbi:MAG: hypothetical protein ABIN91_00920 [Mucilaginibacter sp.]|uniref:hypothetical protein n=1 Tax=Mucilaginibacter sp. TaxID=1882438 RepID=UPI003262DB0F
MTITEHINTHDAELQPLIETIHSLILKHDQSVEATVGNLMGKEMIIYNDRGSFKYALGVGKDLLSLHCLPIYMNPELHGKYQALLPKAKVQKGCINFKGETDMPLNVVASLIDDCAPIDLIAIRQQQLDARKKKK